MAPQTRACMECVPRAAAKGSRVCELEKKSFYSKNARAHTHTYVPLVEEEKVDGERRVNENRCV